MTEIELYDIKYRCYEDGKIEKYYDKQFRHFNEGWNEVNYIKMTDEYIKIKSSGKLISAHRLIAIAFLGLNYNDKTIFIDHINHNKSDNRVSNLRLVTNQQNQWNQKNVKGYSKNYNKFVSLIRISNKQICLGRYDTAEEANQVYLEAKQKYHKI
jgi:hypothetical protein